MQTAQMQRLPRIGWRPARFSQPTWRPDVVFAFGSRDQTMTLVTLAEV